MLRFFEQYGVAPADEAATALGLPVAVVEAICDELEGEGLTEAAPRH